MNETPQVRPWGATRAVPVTEEHDFYYSAVELDKRTQTATYRDPTGRPIEATNAQHDGTMKTIVDSKPTGGGDGQHPPPPDDSPITTYVPD